ncbi:MAG TPA: (5-formylfuran-3-yl)methyl phosphate synthase [Gemmataceae bacterium]|nr:(5-formylfuran-3-yl)methyl phosphate synthase [Gemmataceae bacterium]
MNLLVSVRSAAEAEAALLGGAALIDVKEPGRGALGCADAEVMAAVLDGVAGRRPVSAALGELTDKKGTQPFSAHEKSCVPFSLAFVKWGLAGCRDRADWRGDLERAAHLLPPGCRPVVVAYADWRRAAAPPPADVCAFACSHGWGAFLIDTWGKDGTTLLDWLSLDDLRAMRAHCRAAAVPIALAGSLGVEQMRQLRPLAPDWFAIRGAACQDGQRTRTIDANRVRQLVDLLDEPVTAAIPAG